MEFDFAPDGETIFYLNALEGLRRLNRATREDRLPIERKWNPITRCIRSARCA